MAALSFDDLIPASAKPNPRDAVRTGMTAQQLLSDEDVFGAASQGAARAPARAPALLSDDEVFGGDSSLTDYAREGVTAFAEQGKNLLAGTLKGYGAAAPVIAERQIESLDKINAPPTDDSPEARAAYRVRRGVQHPTDEVIAQRRAALEERANLPIEQQPLYRAGRAVEDFGKETLGASPGWEKSWTRDIMGGLGSMTVGVGASLIPGAGPGLAASIFLGAGMGEAVDTAIKKGATEEQARKAAEFGAIAGATDMVDALLPALGSTGKALGFIRRVGTRAIYGSLAEGGQEGLQQLIQNTIAQKIYNPDQDLLEDVPRSAAIGAIVGGVTSGGFAAAERRQPVRHVADTGIEAGAVPADTIIPAPAETPVAPAAGQIAPEILTDPASADQIRSEMASAQPAAPAPIPPHGTLARAVVRGQEAMGEAAAAAMPMLTPGPGEAVAQGAAPALGPDVSRETPAQPGSREGTAEVYAPAAVGVGPEQMAQPTATPVAPGQGIQGTAPTTEIPTDSTGDGTRTAPVEVKSAEDVARAGAVVDTAPTEAQKEAGNYQKAHIKVAGLDVTIENPQGSIRSGISAEGTPWSVKMPATYGYVKRTTGKDGDQVDVYIGPQPTSERAFVVDQFDPKTGRFDEHKVMLGFPSEADALAAYDAAFSDGTGPARRRAVSDVPVDEFKAWLEDGDTKKQFAATPAATKPAAKRQGKKGPLSIVEFIAQNGGIDPRDPLIADVRSVLGTPNKFVPGFGMLIRPTGKSLDNLREAAVEAGYLHDAGAIGGGVSESSINDLLEAIDSHGRVEPVYSEQDRDEVARRKEASTTAAQAEQLEAAEGWVRETAQALGVKNLTADEMRAAAELILVNNADAVDAVVEIVERSHYAGIEEAVSYEAPQESGHADVATGADQSRAGQPQAGEQPARPAGEGTAAATPQREQPGRAQHDRGQERRVAAAPAEAAEGALIPEGDRGAEATRPTEAASPAEAVAPALDGEIIEPGQPNPKALHDEIRETLAAAYMDASPGESIIDTAIESVQDEIKSGATKSPEGVPWTDVLSELKRRKAEHPDATINARGDIVPLAKPKQIKAPETGPSDSGDIALAHVLLDRLNNGQPITAMILQDEATKAHGGTLAEGKFDRKDAQDALELAVNMHIKDTRHLRVDSPDPRHAMRMLGDVLAGLPTQRVRSEEQQSFQQFSTPPNYAAAAAFAANLRAGDTMLEPSAGTGSLVAAASMPGVKIIANELSPRRTALLRELIGEDGQVFTENAEQIDNILDVKPSVVLMNPPFSQTAGRMGDKKVPMIAAEHIEAALNLLQPGGRLVAIVGRGMTMGAPVYRAWWAKIGKNNTIRANIGVDGKVYEKYGTTFGTRLLVIDKVEPESGYRPVLADAQTVDDLMRALEPIRNVRSDAQQSSAEPGRSPLAEGSGRAVAPSAPAQSGGVGPGERGTRGVAGSRPSGAIGTGEPAVRLEAGKRADVAAVEPGRPGAQRAGGEPAQQPQLGQKLAAGSSAITQRDLQPAASGQPGAATGSERVELETAAPGTQAASEINESLYQTYEPARVRVKGAKPHPGPLVESASMSSVEPPATDYKPSLPKKVIEKGLLSLAQLEPVIYAGRAHASMLPAADNETPQRRGFFIGDGTGVGKGREIAGIILDNWNQGRTKAVWVSEKQKLLNDAKRDWSGIEQNPAVIFNAGKTKTGEPIAAERGIAFITYDTLKGGMSDQAAITRGSFVRKQPVSVNGQSGVVQRIEQGRRGEQAQITVKLDNGTEVTVPGNEVTAGQAMVVKSRVDQLVDWFGKDFDGVVAFDESHNMGNATSSKGERGDKNAAQKALAGLELQRRLPNARIVYVSATGATEVSNLAYAERLGLWGRGTAFASQSKFVAEVESGGIAAMEIIARDMKQLGLYTARNLSYDGVEYDRVEHKLDANQHEIYDTLAEAWQNVLRNINEALEETGGNKDARAKSAAMSAFWGSHQRFFNQIITSMQMPSVIKAVEADLAANRQAVLQLTNTNEASQERAAAKAKTAEDIEDLDITPRDQIIQLVERSFPTQEYEVYVDQDGKERSRPVVDSQGNPVQNKQAVAMKEVLIDRLASVRVPQGPLDMILDHFGVENVAEVTGRGRRFVLKPDEKTGERRRQEESRPGSANQSEIDTFQNGKKKILVFSEAGGTGASYHADNTTPSKDARRAHYLVQGGWRADKAVQGFGRTHRTNQASAPIVRLVTTDLQGQKRFISSIARRLAQLGALTKGQRQAGDQGIFSARDNLESTEAHHALRQFYNDLLHDAIPGVGIAEFEEQTGLTLRTQDEEGRVTGVKEDLPPITQFLNRLLSLKVDMQNHVFDAFSERLDRVIEARQAAGLLDVGLETVKADKIVKDSERTVHTVEESKAETKHVKFTVSNKFNPIPFKLVADDKKRPIKFWAISPKDRIYAVAEAASMTNEKGAIVDYYRLINPVSGSHVIERSHVDNGEKWSKVDRGRAQEMWQHETEQAPEYLSRDLHLITGAILPIWDRLGGSTRVVRLRTDSGEHYIGRVVPKAALPATLKKLGAESEAAVYTPQSVFDAVITGGRATLTNGWTLSRRLVAGEHRIELKGPSSFSEGNEVKADGVFTERINYELRYFVPANAEAGQRVIGRLTKFRQVVDLSEGGTKPTDIAAGDEPMFSVQAGPMEARGANATMRGPFTGEFTEHAKAVASLLRQELDRLGLKDIPLNLVDRIEIWMQGRRAGAAEGMYFENAITLALGADKKFKLLHHEALHALRALDLFKDTEWNILRMQAQRKWRNDFNIERRYASASEETKNEEGVAHAYAAWANGEIKVDGRVARLFKRIQSFLEALGNALRGAGFKSVDSIFRDIKGGEIGERGDVKHQGPEPLFARRDDSDLFKTEVVQTPDGPREQGVIPGAEKITPKQQAERQAQKPLASGKKQKAVDGLPLFKGEPDPDLPMFALQREPETALDRQRASQGFLARGQFIDRAIRVPFDIFGGVTRDGEWKPGHKLFEKAGKIITGASFKPDGRFSFLNPIMETARSGLVDRYNLRDMPDYVERERARALDERAVMLQGAEILKSLKDHAVGPAEAKVLQAILTGEDVSAGDMGKLAEPIREAIDQLGQEAVDLGLVSAESFERNRGTYLHRVYQKYEAEQNGLARMVNGIMGARRKKIIGDQFRGRGLFSEIELPRLMRDVPDWHEGARGKPENGEKFVRLDEMAPQQQLALDENKNPEKVLRTVYWPADRAIPDRYSAFRNQGIWQVRGTKNGKIVLWRDFTKAERESMGEILDARYTIGKTFSLMAHDLSVGKFYKDIAENEAWTLNATPNAKWLDAGEWSAQARRYKGPGDIEWVRVPDVEIPNSGGKKRWGALSGKWVREAIWRDLNEIDVMSRPSTWRALLTQWKLNKTARSPVVHMNNVMSNFVLMDMMDVRMQDLAQGVRSYASGDTHYKEAFENGAFGADMITQEVRDQVLKPILEELQKSNTFQQGGRLGLLGQISKLTELLKSKYKIADQFLKDAYRIEDEVFRMATYIRRRQLGDDPKQAATVAREQFIDYDIRAPWINAARNTVLPFISYTYRAVPLVAKAVATRPWKLAKYATLAYLANALAYALTGGDEDRERRSLREQEQGRTWIGANRMTRMPVNDQFGNPIFLDIRRWMPAGDVFDFNQGQSPLPIPSFLNMGGPLLLGAELFLNKQAFTGQPITNEKTDDAMDKAGKVADWAYKSWMPSAAYIPGSWYWEKIANAYKGATDRQGRPYDVGTAAASSVGIKLKPQDVEDGFAIKAMEFRRVEQELKTEGRRLSNRRDRKIISEAEFNKSMNAIEHKLERLGEKRTETFKD